jgi:hypothetical protein
MAGPGLTLPAVDPAAGRVLEGYLAELAAALAGLRPARAEIVAEVADGLTEATVATSGGACVRLPPPGRRWHPSARPGWSRPGSPPNWPPGRAGGSASACWPPGRWSG